MAFTSLCKRSIWGTSNLLGMGTLHFVGILFCMGLGNCASAQSGAEGQDASRQAAEESARRAGAVPGYQSVDGSMEGMEYDSGYEPEDGSGYGIAPANVNATTPVEYASLLTPGWTPLKSRLSSLALSLVSDGQVAATGPRLRREAEVAFRYGNLPLAIELFHGHLARGGSAAAADLDAISYFGLARIPAWHVRLAVSVAIRGDQVTDANPIQGSEVSADGLADMQGMEGAGMEDLGAGMEEMAGGMMNAMQARMQAQQMAMQQQMQAEMDASMSESYADEGMGIAAESSLGATGNNLVPVVPKPQPTSEEAVVFMTDKLGLVAAVLRSEISSRFSSGKFGAAMATTDLTDESSGYTVNGQQVSAPLIPMWTPGVLFLGENFSPEATKLAVENNVDLLIHFDVALKELRPGLVQNVSRLRLIDCRTGKTVVTSGAMDNSEVDRLQRTGRGTATDHVNQQLAMVWKILDERLTVRPMPELTSETAKRRIAQMFGDSRLGTLRQLAEIRYFAHRNLLSTPEIEQAFEIAGGAEAQTILNGADSEAYDTIMKIVERTEQ